MIMAMSAFHFCMWLYVRVTVCLNAEIVLVCSGTFLSQHFSQSGFSGADVMKDAGEIL